MAGQGGLTVYDKAVIIYIAREGDHNVYSWTR